MIDRPMENRVLPERDNTKLAMWLFLGGEVVFFVTLILTYIFFRMINPVDFAKFKAELNIPLIGLNTFILISSSYMVVRSLEAAQDNRSKSARNNLIAVFVLGALFLAGQAFEWTMLFQAGFNFSSLFGTPFFSITGVHGAHVFVGLIWCAFAIYSTVRGDFSHGNYRGLELFGLYWHFVDIVWIVLFTLFYLM